MELTSAKADIVFAKYHSLGVDLVLVADPEDRLSVLSEHHWLRGRSFGIGCTAVLRVLPGAEGSDLVVDDGGGPYSNVWMSPAWDAALRCAAAFARDEGLTAGGGVIRIAMRASEHLAGVVPVRFGAGSLVTIDAGVPKLGLVSEPAASGMPFDLQVEVPAGFDPGHNWWALADDAASALTVVPVMMRGHIHAVVRHDDVVGLFRYVGPSSCLSPGLAGEPTRRLVANTPALAELETSPILDILRVDSPDQITVDGVGGYEGWPQGDGTCAAAVVARSSAGTLARVYAPSGFGDMVIDWDGRIEDGRPIISTAPTEKVFDGRLPNLQQGRRATDNRKHLRALMS